MPRAKKLDNAYYVTAKNILKDLTGVPSKSWEEISTVSRADYFRPDAVSLFLASPEAFDRSEFKRRPQYVTEQYKKFLETFPKSSELKKKFPTAEIIITDLGYSGVENRRWVPIDSLVIIIPQTDIDAIAEVNTTPDRDTISFWSTEVFDLRNTAIAYGAKITTVDGWKFPDKGDIGRIQTNLGERRFYEFSKGGTRSFNTYNALVKYLKSVDPYIQIPSEQNIIDSGYDERFYTN